MVDQIGEFSSPKDWRYIIDTAAPILDRRRISAIGLAIRKDAPYGVIKFLLDSGETLRSEDNLSFYSHEPALLQWIGKRGIGLALRLIDVGADINSVGYEGHTALDYAARNNDPFLMGELLDRGAESDIPNTFSPLISLLEYPASKESEEMALELIEDGAASTDHRSYNIYRLIKQNGYSKAVTSALLRRRALARAAEEGAK